MIWLNGIVFMEVFTPTECAGQDLKAVKFGTSELSSYRICLKHYYPIQWNNNSKVTAGSERLNDLLEVTQQGPLASSL